MVRHLSTSGNILQEQHGRRLDFLILSLFRFRWPKARPSFQAVPRIQMEPELERNICVDQNHGFYLAEGIGMLAKESNGRS